MKKLKIFFLLSLMMIGLGSCIYDWVAEEEVPPIDGGTEISFSTQILPIFNSGNNCTSCHKPGRTSPDLTAANAYSQINQSKYINTANPAESLIYKVPSPNGTTHRHKTYTASEAALILAWIQQGAKNN